MTIELAVGAAVEEFRSSGRIVIVGASLAGLRAAEALREEGFRGRLTIIGDEPYEPYDRPPLSKQVLHGWVPADHTKLPRMRAVDADWRLGVAATGLDRTTRQVLPGRRRAGRVRPPADRHRRARPALVQPGGSRAGRGVHASARATTRPGCGRRWPPGPGGSWSSAPGSSAPRWPRSAASSTWT